MGILIFILQFIFLYARDVFCTIDGLSYMDPLVNRPLPQRDDPCNPLYWYPREIPAYCYRPNIPPLPPIQIPVTPVTDPPCPNNKSVPIPVPVPIPLPPPIQGFIPMIPPPPPLPIYPRPPYYPGVPVLPGYPGFPGFPNQGPGFPYTGFGYPSFSGFQNQRPGFVPGLPGLVTRDGGINLLPFSDAYADVLNKHTDRMMTRKYNKYLERKPWRRSRG